MSPATAVVNEFPELDLATGWLGEDSVVDVSKGNAIDLPFAIPR